MKTTIMFAVATIVAISPAAWGEHITLEQLALHELQRQNAQPFVD
jgi:hypothetical protein